MPFDPSPYKSCDETPEPLPLVTLRQWAKIGINPIAAASACYTGQKNGSRSDADAMIMFHQSLELVDDESELNLQARRFTDKCTTYIRTFVSLASANTERVVTLEH